MYINIIYPRSDLPDLLTAKKRNTESKKDQTNINLQKILGNFIHTCCCNVIIVRWYVSTQIQIQINL